MNITTVDIRLLIEIIGFLISLFVLYSKLNDKLIGIQTMLIGYDGKNGMRSELQAVKQDVHELHTDLTLVDHRVIRLEEYNEHTKEDTKRSL